MRALLTLAVPDGAGAHRMALQIGSALQESGWDTLIVTGPAQEREKLTLEDVYLGSGGAIKRAKGFDSTFSLKLIEQLAAMAKQFKADLVLGFQRLDRKYALLAGGRADLPVAIHFGGQEGPFSGTPVAATLKRTVYRHLIKRHLDLGICTSPRVRSQLVDQYGVPAERTVVIPNGVDSGLYSPVGTDSRSRIRHQLGLRRGDTVLVNVGRLDPIKGHPILLDAAIPLLQADSSLKLLIVGDVSPGPGSGQRRLLKRRLKEMVRAADLERSVHFLGWRSDIRQVVGACDLYVHASLSEGPALPLAVLEAMALGVPVVVTDCAGQPSPFVEGLHGYVVASGDSVGLRRSIRRYLSTSPSEKGEMAAAVRTLVTEHYELSKINGAVVCALSAVVR